jgi:hypothetical protein
VNIGAANDMDTFGKRISPQAIQEIRFSAYCGHKLQPKKGSGVATDLSDVVVRDIALPLGLVDIKVCAIDDTWSGLKFVIPKAMRGR